MMSATIVAGAVSRSATVTTVGRAAAHPTASESEYGLNPRNVRRAAVGRPGRSRIRAMRSANNFA